MIRVLLVLHSQFSKQQTDFMELKDYTSIIIMIVIKQDRLE